MTKVTDFIIITALEEEREAVLGKLTRVRRLAPSLVDVQTYYSARLPVTFPNGLQGVYKIIVLSLIGMGRVQAATATSDAIRKCNPRYVILVGIAGGVAASNIGLGDVILSDQVVDYELQKITARGVQLRWEVHRVDPRLLSAARNLKITQWQQLVKSPRPAGGKPKRVIGPIASGDKVIAFSKALDQYKAQWPKLIGVEMEAGGAAFAAFNAASRPGFFMIRGVSDFADENKGKAEVETWRLYACEVAAAYAIALLKSGPIPLVTKASTLTRRRTQAAQSPVKESTHSRRDKTSPDIPIPKIKKTFTQLDKDVFAQNTFTEIKRYFRQAAKLLKAKEPNIKCELTEVGEYKFIYKVYVDGNLKNQCKIWCGVSHRSISICYAERNFDINNDHNYNDWLWVEDDGYELQVGHSNMWFPKKGDWAAKLSQKEAAKYLWYRFSTTLEY